MRYLAENFDFTANIKAYILELAILLAEVVKWQTRWTQNPVVEIPCGFKSRLRHQIKDLDTD